MTLYLLAKINFSFLNSKSYRKTIQSFKKLQIIFENYVFLKIIDLLVELTCKT